MTSRSRGGNQLLSAAHAYAERGWLVFPLIPKDKKPITSQGFIDATHDRNRVLQWWQSFPDANIGLATGNPFDVLDIDGPEGVPALREILGDDYIHAGPVANTGRGWHLYFLADAQGRNRAGLLGGKVDYRGTGGYVVAPPSVHPSGRIYRWDKDRDWTRDLPALPESLHNLIVKAEAKPAPERVVIRGNPGEVVDMDRDAKRSIERPSIIEIIERLGGTVVPKGQNWVTNCFFHHDPGPSMVLYLNDNKFHCYGCEAHGDSRDLLEGKDMYGRRFST